MVNAGLMPELEPSTYASTLAELKRRVHHARYQAQRQVNGELIRLYWQIGRTIREQQDQADWGSKVIARLADDLRAEFPSMKGFSRANLFYMRSFASAWPDESSIVQRAVGQLPWGHIIELLGKLDSRELRDWYAEKDAAHGWSRPVLAHQIKTQLHLREGSAPTNFGAALERSDSELAQQITKDPYALDFLAIDSDALERELEDRLIERIIDTLREFGRGYALVNRQVHFDVDGDDFFIDLLFFHVEQLRYVVVELKTGKFDPRDAGQLSFYVTLVEDRMRLPQHNPTIGMLLVADKNDSVVRYALSGTAQPIAIASYDLLPPAEKAALPTEEALTQAVNRELAAGRQEAAEAPEETP